jgi:OPA family glycerol-3-phosphate transporter-like MFS transporter
VDKVTQEVVPILILVVAISLVVARLPKVDVGLSAAFKRRRTWNWVPLGLSYAFLYMGRYNMNSLIDHGLITSKQFGEIDAIGAVVYGLAFLVNGPLCDRLGGRFTMLVATAGASVANLVIGLIYWKQGALPSILTLTILNAVNMYFQSFGAVSIVKVNASWFHLRERGTFGGIFGILISLGFYLALDWAPKIADLTHWSPSLFVAPAIFIAITFVASFIFVRDTPADAGLGKFDVADASSGDDGPPEKALVIIKRLLTNRVILTIALISGCSGFLRQGILKWFRTFAAGVGINVKDAAGHIANPSFIVQHWGMVSCCAGILGGVFAGVLSDHLFKSRRPPVAVALLGFLLVGSIAIIPALAAPIAVTFIVAFMAMAVIGVHGMLSGVASQDFGGRRNAGTATGLIDGFVYFGTALQATVYGHILPESKVLGPDGHTMILNPASKLMENWYGWPIAMIIMAVLGIILALTVINARVQPKQYVGQVISDAADLPQATAHEKS